MLLLHILLFFEILSYYNNLSFYYFISVAPNKQNAFIYKVGNCSILFITLLSTPPNNEFDFICTFTFLGNGGYYGNGIAFDDIDSIDLDPKH